MQKGSFGGKPPYLSDFEASDELTPDPFAEEPLAHSTPHPTRGSSAGRRSKKVKSMRNDASAGDESPP